MAWKTPKIVEVPVAWKLTCTPAQHASKQNFVTTCPVPEAPSPLMLSFLEPGKLLHEISGCSARQREPNTLNSEHHCPFVTSADLRPRADQNPAFNFLSHLKVQKN